MSDKLYRIKSLEWRDIGKYLISSTPIGDYSINKENLHVIPPRNASLTADSIEDAKEFCQAYFDSAMSAGLVEAVCVWTDAPWLDSDTTKIGYMTSCDDLVFFENFTDEQTHCQHCGGKITEGDHAE